MQSKVHRLSPAAVATGVWLLPPRSSFPCALVRQIAFLVYQRMVFRLHTLSVQRVSEAGASPVVVSVHLSNGGDNIRGVSAQVISSTASRRLDMTTAPLCPFKFPFFEAGAR